MHQMDQNCVQNESELCTEGIRIICGMNSVPDESELCTEGIGILYNINQNSVQKESEFCKMHQNSEQKNQIYVKRN